MMIGRGCNKSFCEEKQEVGDVWPVNWLLGRGCLMLVLVKFHHSHSVSL